MNRRDMHVCNGLKFGDQKQGRYLVFSALVYTVSDAVSSGTDMDLVSAPGLAHISRPSISRDLKKTEVCPLRVGILGPFQFLSRIHHTKHSEVVFLAYCKS